MAFVDGTFLVCVWRSALPFRDEQWGADGIGFLVVPHASQSP